MAMSCISGARECDGCGRCFREFAESCPVCGAELAPDDALYRHLGATLGCSYCIEPIPAWEAAEEREDWI